MIIGTAYTKEAIFPHVDWHWSTDDD